MNTTEQAIGVQINAEVVYFGGEEPSDPEREGLLQLLDERFNDVLERGALGFDDDAEIDEALQRLFGSRGRWVSREGVALASVVVSAKTASNLLTPLEWLQPPASPEPLLVRCELEDSETVPEDPCPRPVGGRLILATSTAGGAAPAEAIAEQVRDGFEAGFPEVQKSDASQDLLGEVSLASLDQGLAGASALVLVCHVCEDGLLLRGEHGEPEAITGPELAETLRPFAGSLRLVVLAPLSIERGHAMGSAGAAVVEAALALHRAGLASVVAPRLPLPTKTITQVLGSLVSTLLGDARTPPSSLERAITVANRKVRGLARMGLRLYARAENGDDTRPFVIRPYRALLSFDREQARFYVGRDSEVKESLCRLAEFEDRGQARMLLLVGASGVGKSSLAKAGIAPRLADEGWAPVLIGPENILEIAPGDPEGTRRLIIVDQLEKLVPQLPTTKMMAAVEERLQRLWSLASDDAGTAVVATMRVDALNVGGALIMDAADRRSVETLATKTQHGQFIRHLEPKDLVGVIEEPARRVGLRFEEGLVDRLCQDAMAEPGTLPMLELVLDKLWERRASGMLCAESYQGGLATMLSEHANECIDELDPAEHEQAKRILARAATSVQSDITAWRRRTSVNKLRPRDKAAQLAFDRTLEVLVAHRLVVRGRVRKPPSTSSKSTEVSQSPRVEPETVELAHDLLLRRWPKLIAWVQSDRDKLRVLRSLEGWVEEHHARQMLLTAGQLHYVEDKLGDNDDELNNQMLALLRASRRQLRRRRWLLGGFLGFAVSAALALSGLSYWAVTQRNKAEEQAQLAQRRLNQATDLAQTLVWEVIPKLGQHPEVRPVRKEILELLQEMLRELGVTDSDTRTLRQTMVAHNQRGDEALHSDNIEVARDEYEKAFGIAMSLWTADPMNPQARHDLSVSLTRLGDVGLQAGNLSASRDYYQRSLKVTEGLAKADLTSARAQLDLSTSLNKMGNVEELAGNLSAAREHYQRSYDIKENLAKADPTNTQVHRDLSIYLNELGYVEILAGNLSAAREYYQRSLDVAEGLAKTDPTSALAQLDLSVSLNKLGDVEVRAGNLSTAREHYQRSHEVFESLATADPTSAQTQRNLSISLNKLGDVEVQAGNLSSAHDYYRQSLKVTEKLATMDPTSAQAQRDLSISLEKMGYVESQVGNLSAAYAHYQRCLEITEKLAIADPTSAQAQRDLSVSLNKLGDVEVQAGEFSAARDHYRRSLKVAKTLAKVDQASAQAQRDVSISLEKLGDMEVRAGNLSTASEHYQRSLKVAESLAKADPMNSRTNFDVVQCHLNIIELAIETEDIEVLRRHLKEAMVRLQNMDRAGQVEGYHEREAVRDRLAEIEDQLDR